MAENSKIEWTDHTFNPWMGCTKVSDGCKFCYAEREMDHRYHKVKWGPQGKRVRTAKQYWKQPLKWNMTWFVQCEVCGLRQAFNELVRCPGCEHPIAATMKTVRQRVFCGSLCDVFERKEDQKEMDQWRADLFQLIYQTPNLDWLLLTKRPENIERMIPWDGIEKHIPTNIWWGFSAENQKEFDVRVPIMESFSRIYHQTYFVSIEPLLGPIDITGPWLEEIDLGDEDASCWSSPIDWVICGGESGPDARPLNPAWARSLRDQCKEADVPFFFKQWGEWVQLKEEQLDPGMTFKRKPIRIGDDTLFHLGKHRAGRFGRYLDGQEFMEFPK
jgi:protein gp37